MNLFTKLLVLFFAFSSAFVFAQLKINSEVTFSDKMVDVLTDTKISLSELKGKIVVLEWFNQKCPFVEKHYNMSKKNMQNLQAEAKKAGVIWITVNSSAEGNEGFIKDNIEARKIRDNLGMNSNYFVLDHNGSIGKMFGAKVTPHMFIIKDGKLVYEGAIDSKKSTEVADIEKAKKYFADAMTSIIAGNAPLMASTEEYGCSVKYSTKASL